ncbi:Type-1 fimbrial protein, A chain [Achromobacter deleyi]|uniref:Type-1 fimbrial protein, A chain n=1 Tax=Achromobacter deleyi TaxID=1353891 RepID=A0A6S7A0E1_9BURK|nr:fimbrial protein [Achromobacter deleyi]CAB3699247.1 Type-1 fimbrial protein, A chain [Achromobacter deleyi]CAB3851852.1 Type-1 fimbrial protein, A chain [Achromobacter deleyi]CAB3867842.1 Type-1 fimbrial protein, A chain [Achromobacter deleyi]CAB3874642.1 Type-1 fimbrial protein, A chain [Achromobacter deleyi]
MKNFTKRLVIAVGVSGAFVDGTALAADGNISFHGQVNASPCAISPVSQNMTINMGSWNTASFTAKGSKTVPAKFTIGLLRCSADKTASVRFDGISDADGNLRIGAGEVISSVAKGIAIQLQDSAGAAIQVGSNSGEYSVLQGDNHLQFQAAYIQTADSPVGGGSAVTAGTANATAQFTVAYQ